VSQVSLNSEKSFRTFDVEKILGPFKAMLRAEVGPELIEYLLSALERFTGKQWEQEDDVMMIVLSRGASSYQ